MCPRIKFCMMTPYVYPISGSYISISFILESIKNFSILGLKWSLAFNSITVFIIVRMLDNIFHISNSINVISIIFDDWKNI